MLKTNRFLAIIVLFLFVAIMGSCGGVHAITCEW